MYLPTSQILALSFWGADQQAVQFGKNFTILNAFALISVCDRDDAHVWHHLPQLMSP